jgi:aldehyde:ferredoxin oxidoreductase
VTTKKLVNIRYGWTADQDTLPPRLLEAPLETSTGRTVTLPRERLEEMVAGYYVLRGWDADGRPTPALLREIGLEEAMAA